MIKTNKIKTDPVPKYIAHWSGGGFALCNGEWSLFKNTVDRSTGNVITEDISDMIPESHIDCPMYTYGEYEEWYFGGESGWEEEWRTYEDGLDQDDWVEENKEWLDKIADGPIDYGLLYEAFQKEDFRYNSCGGCI